MLIGSWLQKWIGHVLDGLNKTECGKGVYGEGVEERCRKEGCKLDTPYFIRLTFVCMNQVREET